MRLRDQLSHGGIVNTLFTRDYYPESRKAAGCRGSAFWFRILHTERSGVDLMSWFSSCAAAGPLLISGPMESANATRWQLITSWNRLKGQMLNRGLQLHPSFLLSCFFKIHLWFIQRSEELHELHYVTLHERLDKTRATESQGAGEVFDHHTIQAGSSQGFRSDMQSTYRLVRFKGNNRIGSEANYTCVTSIPSYTSSSSRSSAGDNGRQKLLAT